jgi:hypothetical protein
MCKQIIIGLFALSAVALLGNKANAGCIPLAGGGQYCSKYIKGTTEFFGFAKGLGNLQCTEKNPQSCPTQDVQLWGAYQTDTSGPCGVDNPSCLISVEAICGPQKCLNNPNLPGCQNMDYNSVHFSKDQIQTELSDYLNCKHNGSCQGLLTFLADIGSEVCRPGHVLIDAFAVDFYGEACFDYNGTSQCITEYCYIDPIHSLPGDVYTCTETP